MSVQPWPGGLVDTMEYFRCKLPVTLTISTRYAVRQAHGAAAFSISTVSALRREGSWRFNQPGANQH